jgi:pteridine reductase
MMNNPTALITGAARRIGKAIAKALHQQNYNVVIHYRNSKDDALTLASELNQLRAKSAVTIQGDLNQDCYQQLIEQAQGQWQRLDLLVNNASSFYQTNLEQCKASEFDDLMASNCKAPFFLSRYAAPYLKESGGNIINITDIHGIRPIKDHAFYCMAKAALTMQTQVLAKELGPDVRVNAIAPGMMVLPEGDNCLDEKEISKLTARNTLKRIGSANDIAQAVVYLNKASYVTGQILQIDGGRLLRS